MELTGKYNKHKAGERTIIIEVRSEIKQKRKKR
jgi:hypothetical protein